MAAKTSGAAPGTAVIRSRMPANPGRSPASVPRLAVAGHPSPDFHRSRSVAVRLAPRPGTSFGRNKRNVDGRRARSSRYVHRHVQASTQVPPSLPTMRQLRRHTFGSHRLARVQALTVRGVRAPAVRIRAIPQRISRFMKVPPWAIRPSFPKDSSVCTRPSRRTEYVPE
jgi:hypothetical protein